MTTSALTRKEFALRYRMHVNTVDALRRRGEVKWFRLGRKVYLLPIDEQAEAARRAK